MGEYDDSLMAQSKSKNTDYLMAARVVYEHRKNEGDSTIYSDLNKKEAKKFSLFRFLKKKTDKTGRFGGRTADTSKDSIQNVEKRGNLPVGYYFDPLGLEFIKPQLAAYLDMDEDKTDQEAMARAKLTEADFVKKVDEEIVLSAENDFEKNRITEAGRLAAVEDRKKETGEILRTNTDYVAGLYDAGRKFIPDTMIRDVPDGFNLELIVSNPPPKYAQEWDTFRAEKTKGIGARIKGVFRKMFGGKEPSDEELFNDFYQSLPEFKRIKREGMQAAQEQGIKYDPKKDPKMMSFVSELMALTKAYDNGHAIVRMNATKGGSPVSSYSFGFIPMNGAGMAGAITGSVHNPDKAKEGAVIGKFPVSYPNFLRAAARIRGNIGAMRTYSLIGYNCTSFVADVGLAAGINIKAEDTSDIIMTHRHRAQRVDSPYMMAKFLRRKNEEDESKEKEEKPEGTQNAQNENKEDIVMNAVPVTSVDVRADELYEKNKDRIFAHGFIKVLQKTNRYNPQEITENFKAYLKKIITESDIIDGKYPTEGLGEDEALINENARAEQKRFTIGAVSVEKALDRILGINFGWKAFYNVISGAVQSETDYTSIFREMSKKEAQEKEQLEKLKEENSEEKNRAGKQERAEEKGQDQSENRMEITEDINPEGTNEKQNVIYKPRRELIQPPTRVTSKNIKGMLEDLFFSSIAIDPFITVFNRVAKIEGKSAVSSKKLNSIDELRMFFTACNKAPEVTAKFPQLYAEIMNAKTNVEQNQKYLELLNMIVETIPEERIKEILSQSLIY